MTTIPAEVVRDVFGHRDTRALLLHLHDRDEPQRYSDARKDLDIHPQQFERSLKRLEHHGLVGRILGDEADAAGRRPVYLETTAGGRFWAEHWHRFEAEVTADAARADDPESLLSDAVV